MGKSVSRKHIVAAATAPMRCNCAILGISDRQCSRHATVGTLCTQHAKMDRPGNRVFRWDWEDGKPCS